MSEPVSDAAEHGAGAALSTCLLSEMTLVFLAPGLLVHPLASWEMLQPCGATSSALESMLVMVFVVGYRSARVNLTAHTAETGRYWLARLYLTLQVQPAGVLMSALAFASRICGTWAV